MTSLRAQYLSSIGLTLPQNKRVDPPRRHRGDKPRANVQPDNAGVAINRTAQRQPGGKKRRAIAEKSKGR